MTFAPSGAQLSLPLTSSAEASHARTSHPRDFARALLESARVCGVSSLVFSTSFAPPMSSSRTSRAVPQSGWTPWSVSWKSSAMTRYQSRCRRAMSGLRIDAPGYSLLPTLTVSGNYNRKGASPNSGDGLRTRLMLPTLCATTHKSNRGGAAGRTGPDRPSPETMARAGRLPTLTASMATRGSCPSEMRRHTPNLEASIRLLQTLCRRDDKGPGTRRSGGADLPAVLGGHLNPKWCLWFMGFPADWLDVDDALVFGRSAIRSSRSKPK